MAGGNNLEVTSILDPDIQEEDVSLTENDIDLELNEALSATDDDFDFDLSDDIPGLDDLLAAEPDGSGAGTGGDDFLLDEKELGLEPLSGGAPAGDLDIDFDDTLRLEESLPGKAPVREAVRAEVPADILAPSTDDSPDDIDFELESVAEERVPPAASGQGEDIDFDLDDFSLEPAAEAAPGGEEDEIDFELMEVVSEEPEAMPERGPEPVAAAEAASSSESEDEDILDMDFGDLEEEAPAGEGGFEVAAEMPSVASDAADKPDFDLDKILSQDEFETTSPESETHDFDEPEDFELEEIIAETPQARPEEMARVSDLAPEPPAGLGGVSAVAAAEALAAGLAASEVAAPFNGSPAEEAVVPDRPAEIPAPVAAGDVMAALDPVRIEQIIEQTVRDTVSGILERILPSVIEEVVARELAKITQDLAE